MNQSQTTTISNLPLTHIIQENNIQIKENTELKNELKTLTIQYNQLQETHKNPLALLHYIQDDYANELNAHDHAQMLTELLKNTVNNTYRENHKVDEVRLLNKAVENLQQYVTAANDKLDRLNNQSLNQKQIEHKYHDYWHDLIDEYCTKESLSNFSISDLNDDQLEIITGFLIKMEDDISKIDWFTESDINISEDVCNFLMRWMHTSKEERADTCSDLIDNIKKMAVDYYSNSHGDVSGHSRIAHEFEAAVERYERYLEESAERHHYQQI